MISKKEQLLYVLRRMKYTNVTYKEIAKKLNISVNSLYTWMQKENISEKRASYLWNALQRHFADEVYYVIISISSEEMEKEIRDAGEPGTPLY